MALICLIAYTELHPVEKTDEEEVVPTVEEDYVNNGQYHSHSNNPVLVEETNDAEAQQVAKQQFVYYCYYGGVKNDTTALNALELARLCAPVTGPVRPPVDDDEDDYATEDVEDVGDANPRKENYNNAQS